jgi:hypothetical protein
LDIPANLLPHNYLWIAALCYALLMLVVLLSAPWSKIRDNEAQHIFLGTIVMLSLLWVMRGGIQDGLGFHLLGMTLMCLMFEWQFALLAASLVVAISTASGPAGWEAFAVNLLLMGALPVLFTVDLAGGRGFSLAAIRRRGAAGRLYFEEFRAGPAPADVRRSFHQRRHDDLAGGLSSALGRYLSRQLVRSRQVKSLLRVQSDSRCLIMRRRVSSSGRRP